MRLRGIGLGCRIQADAHAFIDVSYLFNDVVIHMFSDLDLDSDSDSDSDSGTVIATSSFRRAATAD